MLLSYSDEEIFRFKITMDVTGLMDGFCPRYHLIRQDLHSVLRELPIAKVEELLE